MNASTLKGMACATLMALATGSTLADSTIPKPVNHAPVTVRYGDLNLATEAGAQVLYKRIRAAALKVCGPAFAYFYPAEWWQWKACYDAAIDVAVKQVNAPALSALHGKVIGVKAGQVATR
jgi:UrcA family protein